MNQRNKSRRDQNMNDAMIGSLNTSGLNDSSIAIVQREKGKNKDRNPLIYGGQGGYLNDEYSVDEREEYGEFQRPKKIRNPNNPMEKNSRGVQVPSTKAKPAPKVSRTGKSIIQNINVLNLFKRDKGKAKGEKLSARQKEIVRLRTHMRRSDTLAALIAFVSAILCYAENQIFYDQLTDNSGNVTKATNTSTPTCNILRGVIIALSIILCILVYLHYSWKLKLLKANKLRLEEDTIKTSGLFWKLLIELIICAICTPPYFDYYFCGRMLDGSFCYSYDAIISVIMLAKSYLVLRLYGQYSRWTSEKAVRVCNKYKAKANLGFAMKAELKKRPFIILAIFIAATVVYLGFALGTFEKSYVPDDGVYPMDLSDLTNSCWVTIITMLTVGFGDGYPSTLLGRFIGVIACILGMLLVSLMVVALTTLTEFMPGESKSFFVLNRLYASNNAKEKAANVVKTLFKIKAATRPDGSSKNDQVVKNFVWFTKLKKILPSSRTIQGSLVMTYQAHMDTRVANSYNLQVDEILKNLKTKLEADLGDIKREVVAIPLLEKKCYILEVCDTNYNSQSEFLSYKERQRKIASRMNDILQVQKTISEQLIKKSQQVL